MAGKEAVWAEIVRENGLIATELDEITNWWFVDAMFAVENQQHAMFMCTNHAITVPIRKVQGPWDSPWFHTLLHVGWLTYGLLAQFSHVTVMISLFAEASHDFAGNWTRHQPMGRIWIWSLCFLDSVSSICGRRRSTKLISICKFWSNWNTRENILVLKAGLED